MGKIRPISIIAMIVMTVVSFINLFGIVAAGLAVIVGVIFFFINKAVEHQPNAGSGLDLRAMGTSLKERSIWLWIALPLVMDAVSVTLAKLFLPGYIDHVLSRTQGFVALDRLALAAIQMVVLALGEEIAWRAFFQKQAQKVLPVPLVLVISSFLFAIGHVTSGPFVIVAYDVFFVFVNSILYGVVFHKTNNAWVSTLSHYAANLFSLIVLVLWL